LSVSDKKDADSFNPWMDLHLFKFSFLYSLNWLSWDNCLFTICSNFY